ncbi:MAG: RluA family pseudouridine synthase [Kiritimatiellia bacterium]
MTLLCEDADLLVVDKPAGQIVHPAPGHETGALTEELVRHCPSMANVGSRERPGVVHRLDRETSGVMVFAKTQAAYLDLRRQFESHRDVRKTYLAVLHGAPRPRTGTLDGPVGRERLRAVTHWRVLAKHGPIALVEFRLETGRMHQIRIHAAELGCPVVGDRLYGEAAKDRRLRVRPQRLLLHAVELSFLHPTTGRRLTFAAEPPPDIVYAG